MTSGHREKKQSVDQKRFGFRRLKRSNVTTSNVILNSKYWNAACFVLPSKMYARILSASTINLFVTTKLYHISNVHYKMHALDDKKKSTIYYIWTVFEYFIFNYHVSEWLSNAINHNGFENQWKLIKMVAMARALQFDVAAAMEKSFLIICLEK